MKGIIIKAGKVIGNKVVDLAGSFNLRVGSVFLIIGFLLGICIVSSIIDVASVCEVAFVSREELLNLEKERIKEAKKVKLTEKEESREKELFFGASSNDLEAAIIKAVAKHKGQRVKIIYTTYGGVTGDKVYSISKEVHEDVIKVLSNKNEEGQ